MNLSYTLSEILNLKGLQEALYTLLKAKNNQNIHIALGMVIEAIKTTARK